MQFGKGINRGGGKVQLQSGTFDCLPVKALPFFCLPFFCLGLLFSNLHDVHGDEIADRLDDRAKFFENKIRPALVQHCLECHATETEASGGLLLDSRTGWEKGGDSGEVIVPGHADRSRLLKAIRYEIPKLQMPPNGRLPKETVALFEKWIEDGAVDPRQGEAEAAVIHSGLTVDNAQQHWAYRDLQSVQPPKGVRPGSGSIDAFIEERLLRDGIAPAKQASSMALVRRLYFDLTGLPPPASELQAMAANGYRDSDYSALVDRLLESPQFGEHFARKWMDVARYAESVTLRGFVLPQAWRYRDYLVKSYAADRPFDQMIREQIAGDLLEHSDLEQRQMQVVATGFLALGNTNLEEQDKTQLEMDYIDEQLDVIGAAFLGQTIGCARCHNHKFDPIPTRDYYAMAGILRSAIALEHENVSKWIEQPLPMQGSGDVSLSRLTAELEDTNKQIAGLKKQAGKGAKDTKGRIAPEQLPGIVIDSRSAKLVGIWSVSGAVSPTVGENYIHDDNSDKGKKTATFEPQSLVPGTYDVRFAYAAHGNRATNAKVRVFSADGESTIIVNERLAPPEDDLWISLGKYRFEKDGQAFVLVTNDDSDGVVIADAVQFLPVEEPSALKQRAPVNAANQVGNEKTTADPDNKKQNAAVDREIKALEAKKKKLEAELAKQPKYLTVVEKGPGKDIPIHIRGDVHNLGEIAPRGFLSAIRLNDSLVSKTSSPGRVEMANWISSPNNPLTARVYANRVWGWLMGQGIVSTTNNFGTTGSLPSHPEMLDWLANELVRSGWSTKHMVRTIVLSDAYRRGTRHADEHASKVDPSNQLYWRGGLRRLPVEALRDAMLAVSGELDPTMGGSLIRDNTKADYNYQHESTRRSIYHPLFRNSLPEIFEAFDFADSSMSIGQRPRTTVAPQALALLNNPWVVARAKAAAIKYLPLATDERFDSMLSTLYMDCFGRMPSDTERIACREYLNQSEPGQIERLQSLI
ncbi:MAG: DUF1553 domain-containing protein, partial [Pirellula sp.]